MSTSPPSVDRSAKAINEKSRRDMINEKVDVLRDLFLGPPIGKKISQGEVLRRTVLLLNGQDPNGPILPAVPSPPSNSASSSPGPIRNSKEVRKDREQGRRDLQSAGFSALQKYINDNGLSTDCHLGRSALLDIAIAEVRRIMQAGPAPIAVPDTTPAAPIFPVLTTDYLLYLCLLAANNQQNANQ